MICIAYELILRLEGHTGLNTAYADPLDTVEASKQASKQHKEPQRK